MTKYTRRHYEDIALLLNKLPSEEREKQKLLWEEKFAADNPRFSYGRFEHAVETGHIERSRKKIREMV